MKKRIILTIGIFLIFIVALSCFIVLFFVQGTTIGTGDGFTLFGSTLQVTDLKFTYEDNPYIYYGSTPRFAGTKYKWDSKYWLIDYEGATDSLFDKSSTDENIIINANGKWYKDYKTPQYYAYTINALLKVPINDKKIRIDLESSFVCYGRSAKTQLVIGNTNIDIGGCNGRTTSYSNVLIETIPNIFDEKTEVYVGGILKHVINKTDDKTYLKIVTYNQYEDSTGYSSSAKTMIKNVRYQPLLSCIKDSQDLLAQQSFTGGSEVSLDKFRFPVKQFCYSHPVIIIKGDTSGIDESYYIIEKLINGVTLKVPEDEIWTIQYIFDNSDGLVSTICPSGELLDENGVCKKQAGLVLAFTQGTLNTNTSTFTIEPKTICENIVGAKAIWDEDTKTCKIPQPVINYCTEENGCVLLVSKICENSNLKYDSVTQSCISDVKIDVTKGEIKQNATLTQFIIWALIGLISLISIITIILMLKR